MFVEFPHHVEFSTRGKVPVSAVSASLLANEQILLELGGVLESLFSGLVVDKINIDFLFATTHSPLKEALSAGIIANYQEKLGIEVPRMIEHFTGIHVAKEYDVLVSVIFIIIVLYGMEWAWKLVKRKPQAEDTKSPIEINGNYNRVLYVARDLVGIEPNEIDAAVRKRFDAKRGDGLARRVLRFISPAKQEKGASIVSGGLSIDASSIEAAPCDADIETSEIEERNTPFQNQIVEIHATDLDSTKRGWAGHLPGVWEKRLRMVLFPGVQPSDVFGQNEIVADVMLISREDESGQFVPYVFHVLKVY